MSSPAPMQLPFGLLQLSELPPEFFTHLLCIFEKIHNLRLLVLQLRPQGFDLPHQHRVVFNELLVLTLLPHKLLTLTPLELGAQVFQLTLELGLHVPHLRRLIVQVRLQIAGFRSELLVLLP